MRPTLPVVLLFALLAAGCATSGPVPTPGPRPAPTAAPATDPALLGLEPLFTGLSMPLHITHAGDGSGRHFVVEQQGRILVARNGTLLDAPFLDIRDKTEPDGERGLLGLAFSPNHSRDGIAYVSYTDNRGTSILARYHLDKSTSDALDPASEEVLLSVAQPYANHNGGHIVFGPDGMLYYGLGDGGSAGDPQGNAQDPNTLLGSILRLDVSPARGYASPEDNPYKHGNGRAEVWAIGLRNPWRFSFDRETGDLYIGDVGQNRVEEIDFHPAGAEGGVNFGWNRFEGNDRFLPLGEAASETTAPIATYTHDGGKCSVTGGYVYRGRSIPALAGTYLYADYCSGTIWGLRYADGAWADRVLLESAKRVSSFGEDADGELFLVDHEGAVMRIVKG